MDQQEFDKGYKAAIEAIRQMASGSSSSSSNNSDISGLEPIPPQQSSDGSGNKSSKTNSRDDSSNPNQGVVRPEDCIGQQAGQLSGTPGTPGGMIDRSVGDAIAKKEGYPDDGPGESSTEKDWKDTALKSTQKMTGKEAGSLKSKLEGLYKVVTNWKKIFKQIIGYAISPDDKRLAYTNKNVLISQDRITRTDKDKYDNLSFIMVFVDSSGSMSDEQLRLCLSEVYSLALQKKPIKLVVVQCDTKIQEIKEYTDLRTMQNEFRRATVKGRGGTDLRPCWDLLKNDKKYKGKTAELVMVFTDGYLTQYKRDPRSMNNLYWCIIDNTSFNVQYKDARTKVIFLNSKDIK